MKGYDEADKREMGNGIGMIKRKAKKRREGRGRGRDETIERF